MFKRLSDMSEEAFQEKADLIVQIMQIGSEITPNGEPLITAEEMQQGIIDVLNDDGDLNGLLVFKLDISCNIITILSCSIIHNSKLMKRFFCGW